MKTSFPQQGRSQSDLLAEMQEMKTGDAKWRSGKVFSYVYFAGDEVLNAVKAAYNAFFSENALNPTAFQSLRRMETEVIGMCADLLHGDADIRGSMTSGGTESILMAVKTAREWGKRNKPEMTEPELVMTDSAHPAFNKACHYFGVKAVIVPAGEDFRARPELMEAAITERTVMLVGSAPSYPQGVIDPIEAIAGLAQRRGLLCHVDACVGGFMLPFLQRLGYPIPPFDFAVPGVTSISADIHKYGYAAKGASVVLYRSAALRKLQFYVYTQWAGGIYGSPTMTGTRPGGAIAAAWAALRFIGMEGYLQKAEAAMQCAQRIRKGIEGIPGLKVLGQPDMTILAVSSDQLDVYEVGDEMGLMGWSIDRQQLPPSLHLTITPAHVNLVEEFLGDLSAAAAKARKMTLGKLSKSLQLGTVKGLKKILPEQLMERFQVLAAKHSSIGGKRSAAMYGMMGELQDTNNLDEMIREFLDRLMGGE
ncbi:MAG: aminotransferase class V-fold PLP-dependent enzyme [Bacteroidota bacterium]